MNCEICGSHMHEPNDVCPGGCSESDPDDNETGYDKDDQNQNGENE